MTSTLPSVFVVDPGIAERDSMAMSTFETAFLDVARHLFETYENPQSQCWMTAFLKAEQVFDPPFGATIAHAIAITIKAVSSERLRGFSYYRSTSPIAARAVTDEERYLVLALRAIREHDHSAARLNALLICEGGDSSPLLAALERIAVITGDVSVPVFQPA